MKKLKLKKFPDGIYKGTLYKNSLSGIGTFIYTDGSIYEGSWKNDQKHGHGRFIDTNGSALEAVWNNGD